MENDLLPLLQMSIHSAHLDDRAATVNNYDLACYVIRRVRGAKHNRDFQLSGSADAGNRVARLDRGLGVLDRGVGEARMEEAWRDGVDANAFSSPGRGELARQTEQPRFARGIPDVVRSVGGRLQA